MSNMERLEELLTTMDVPESRTADIDWLSRNLGIRNRMHPNFAEAMKIVITLLNSGKE